MSLPTQAELQDLLDYTPTTGELIWKPRTLGMIQDPRVLAAWNTRYAGKPAFTAIDHKGYRVGAINDSNYRAARVIFKLVYGIDALQVDHEDGDRQNNRIHNLRDVTGLVNQKNLKRPVNNTSGIIGVAWNNHKHGWDAYITVGSKRTHLGRFADKDEAVICRKEAEKAHGFHINHGR